MITELIFDWAKRTPNRTAMIYNGYTLSYRSFARCIAGARRYFARQGYVGSGYAVLAIYNLMNFWILGLALRSLGLTTVALRFAAEVDRLAAEVEKLRLSNVRCVVTGSAESWSRLQGVCTELGVPLLSVSPEFGDPAWEVEAFEAPQPLGGHILMTSGTTGSYKMVLMSAAFDAVRLRERVQVFGVNQNTVFSVFDLPPWTAAGYASPASTWIEGGCAVIEQGDEPYRALLRPGITHALTTPYMLERILSTSPGAFPRNETMQLAVGGGAITQTQIDWAKARITPRLLSLLASTEASIIGFTRLDTPEDHKWHRPVLGRVIEIVDESERPVPAGEIGRLRVSTAGGPTSYLNDEAATRAFFKDGFFYPGDLAIMRSDGRIALQGRVTDVINVRGSKISPAPIEERLAELLGVSSVCLFSAHDDSGEEEILVVIETSSSIDSGRLTAAINQQLAGIPRRVRYVATLPRNQMGKVLRQEVRVKAIESALKSRQDSL